MVTRQRETSVDWWLRSEMSAGRAVHLWAARSESSTRNAIRTAHETRPLLLVSRRRGEALYQVKPPTPPTPQTPQTPPTPRVNLAALNIRRWYQLDTRKSNPIFVSSALWFLPARGRKTRVTYRYRVTKKKKSVVLRAPWTLVDDGVIHSIDG